MFLLHFLSWSILIEVFFHLRLAHLQFFCDAVFHFEWGYHKFWVRSSRILGEAIFYFVWGLLPFWVRLSSILGDVIFQFTWCCLSFWLRLSSNLSQTLVIQNQLVTSHFRPLLFIIYDIDFPSAREEGLSVLHVYDDRHSCRWYHWKFYKKDSKRSKFFYCLARPKIFSITLWFSRQALRHS